MKITVELAGREQELDVEQQGDSLRIVFEGKETVVRLVNAEDAGFVLEYDEPHGDYVRRRRLRAAGYASGDNRQLWVNGSLLQYRRVRRQDISAVGVGVGSLAAEIPSVVSEILVAPGDAVAPGDKLLLLESMKMILPIQAPYAGTVAAIHCVAGQAVQPGIPLVDIAPLAAGD
jgi:biotin carboxyl carrier protein